VDIYDVLMSLKSRLPSELGPALNTLTLIAQSIRATPQDQGIQFPLQHCDDLVEELIDLLAEAASNQLDPFSASWQEKSTKNAKTKTNVKAEGKARPKRARTYRQLHTEALDEEQRIRAVGPGSAPPLDATGEPTVRRSEIVLSVVNTIRNFSVSVENVDFLTRHDALVPLLLRLCDLLDESQESEEEDDEWLRLNALDLLSVRKDTLEILANFGHRVRLDAHAGDSRTPRAFLALLEFFLADAGDRDQVSHDASPVPPPPASSGSSASLPPPSTIRSPVRTGAFGHYVDVALTALSRILVTDANRASIASLPSVSTAATLSLLFEALLELLPLSDTELEACLTTEPGLVIVERIVMALYNLVFLLDERSKASLGQRPGVIRSLARIVKRFSSYAPPLPPGAPAAVGGDYARNPYAVLCDRCLETLKLLSDGTGLPWETVADSDGGTKASSDTSKAAKSALVPEQWFGGGFAPVSGLGGGIGGAGGVGGIGGGLVGSKALLARPPVFASLTPAEALEMHLRGPSDPGFFAAIGHLWDTRRGGAG
jgi:hypothetical protein